MKNKQLQILIIVGLMVIPFLLVSIGLFVWAGSLTPNENSTKDSNEIQTNTCGKSTVGYKINLNNNWKCEEIDNEKIVQFSNEKVQFCIGSQDTTCKGSKVDDLLDQINRYQIEARPIEEHIFTENLLVSMYRMDNEGRYMFGLINEDSEDRKWIDIYFKGNNENNIDNQNLDQIKEILNLIEVY